MLGLDNALLLDAKGRPIGDARRTRSRDWDEVREFCDKVYMPYRVKPLGHSGAPDAVMHGARVRRITVTRFRYGVPIALEDFDSGAGNILVLTTLGGHLRHGVEKGDMAATGRGESFVADCSRAAYWLEGDGDHLQINLTIPHDVAAETAARWFEFLPPDSFWKRKVKFGGEGSAWWALLDYMARSIAEAPDAVRDGRIGAHLEETICVELLKNWAAGAGVDLSAGVRTAAPRQVRLAEAYIAAHAACAPTIAEIARAAACSVRSLSSAFRRFRDSSPGACLREHRLRGVREALLAGGPGLTVAAAASAWGYVNFGVFAQTYRRRFGETPSQTLARGRQ